MYRIKNSIDAFDQQFFGLPSTILDQQRQGARVEVWGTVFGEDGDHTEVRVNGTVVKTMQGY